MWQISQTSNRLVNQSGPMSQASLHAFNGIQMSIAATRGWVSMGDTRFKIERKKAWQEIVYPALKDIRALKADSLDWPSIKQRLADLETLQWWIEDTAWTLGNRPDHRLFQEQLEPVVEAVFNRLQMLRYTAEGPAVHLTPDELVLLSLFDALSYELSQSQSQLSNYLASAHLNYKDAVFSHFDHMFSLLQRLNAQKYTFSSQQRNALKQVSPNISIAYTLSSEVIELRESAQWNVALHLLTREAAPLARRLTQDFQALSQQQNMAMETDAQHIMASLHLALWIAIILVGLCAFLIWFFSRQNAYRFLAPIRRLSAATAAFEKGEIHDDLPITSRDELGELSASFNAMRSVLQKNKNKLKQANSTLEARVAERTLALEEANAALTRAWKQQQILATHDTLTGLPNRALFNDRLFHAIEQAKRQSQRLAVLFIDLDKFKDINDTLGHDIGDLLLQTISQRLASCLRESDTLARFGGDEFVCILNNIKQIDSAGEVAEKMIVSMQKPMTLQQHNLSITSSIGISIFPNDGSDSESLIKYADTAMYDAKLKGRNRYCYINEDERISIIKRDLSFALQRGQFELRYQPIVHLPTQKTAGVEALLYWNHPELGLVTPSEFIPLAENSNRIKPIGEWVLCTACKQNKAWQTAGLPSLTLSVNLSVHQLEETSLPQKIQDILEETQLEPRWLDMEVTETAAMSHPKVAIAVLNTLRGLGLRISLDDFGTGYSSLSYLRKLPVDTLKIDQAFIRNITHNAKDKAIVYAIIVMAQSLSLKVIAEGVETETQETLLAHAGCDYIQGYWHSRPITAEKMTKRLYAEMDVSP